MEDEVDTVLQYARYYGISRNYLDFERNDEEAWLVYLKESVAPLGDLEDPTNVVDPELSHDLNIREKLEIDRNAGRLLACVSDFSNHVADLQVEEPNIKMVKSLKLELPQFRTDHELDVRQFARFSSPPLDDLDRFAFTADVEHDEEMELGAENYKLTETFEKFSTSEKLNISKDDLRCLQSALHDDCDEQIKHEAVEEDSKVPPQPGPIRPTSCETEALEPVTPLLFPSMPVSMTDACSSPVSDLSLLLEPSSPLVAEAKMMEDTLMHQDGANMPVANSGPIQDQVATEEVIDNLQPIEPLCSPSSPLRRKVHDQKLEWPVIPNKVLNPDSCWNSESISDITPQLCTWEQPAEQLEIDIDDIFNELVNFEAQTSCKKLRNESVIEADFTKRLEVPVMDFSVPQQPWLRTQNYHCERESLMKLMQPIAKLRLHYWPGVGKLDKELNWIPFPSRLGKFAVNEHIYDDGMVENIVEAALMRSVIDEDSVIDRPTRRKFFCEDEVDLEVLLAVAGGVGSLLRKRRTEFTDIEDVNEPRARKAQKQDGFDSCNLALNTSLRPQTKFFVGVKTKGNFAPFIDGFSAMNGVDRYLEVQGKRVRAMEKSDGVSVGTSQAIKKLTPASATIVEVKEKSPSAKVSELLSLPNVNSSTTRHIVISPTTLAQHDLIRHMMTLCPALELIERLNPTQLTRLDISPQDLHFAMSGCQEADITISPSTGIILTTLQKIKQKSLPGQNAHSSIQLKISSIAEHYERLLVLVSQGQPDSNAPATLLEDRDCDALANITSYASGLDSTVIVSCIAGGVENCARCIVGLIAAAPVIEEGFALLPDETLWERYLSRAGMNAFAAQTVLFGLKTAGQADIAGRRIEEWSSRLNCQLEKTSGSWGLSAFVMMNDDERVRRYEQLLGGRRVLQRVSKVVDVLWK